MRLYSIILFLLFSASCQKAKKEGWLNKKPLVDYTTQTFVIGAQNIDNIAAVYVYTALQATKLNTEIKDEVLHAKIPMGAMLFSGPARLVVEFENEKLSIFNFTGKQAAKKEAKDFRSPKTVITDSSLTQQQIVYTVTASRNLVVENNIAATEVWNDLAPQEKTYQAQAKKMETSYYVQSGSCRNIRLSRAPNLNGRAAFKTNLLQDAYGNTIVDGTKAIFYIKKRNEITRIERVTDEGKVTMGLPTRIRGPYTIWLEIGVTKSNKIVMQ